MLEKGRLHPMVSVKNKLGFLVAMAVGLALSASGQGREFAALLADFGLELALQSELGIAGAEETGATFEANALLKARHAAAASGHSQKQLLSNGKIPLMPKQHCEALSWAIIRRQKLSKPGKS